MEYTVPGYVVNLNFLLRQAVVRNRCGFMLYILFQIDSPKIQPGMKSAVGHQRQMNQMSTQINQRN